MKIPNLVNWVRNNKQRLDETIIELKGLAFNPPRHSLQPIQKVLAKISYGQLDEASALEVTQKLASPVVQSAGEEVVPAFCKYLANSKIVGLVEFDKFQSMYIIGKQADEKPILVPVRPTFVGLKEDKLTPVFIVPWVNFNLNQFQKLLLSTIVCDSILTQQDFIGSNAEIVALPRIKHTRVRDVRPWLATQYNLLTQDDLSQQFDRYSRALQAVISEIRTAKGP